jgi:hypothetical protein
VSNIDPATIRVVALGFPGAPIDTVPLFLPPVPTPIGAVLGVSLQLLRGGPHPCDECGVGLCLIALVDAWRAEIARLLGCRGRIDAPLRELDWLPRRHRYWGRIALEAPGDTLVHLASGERVYDLHAAAAEIVLPPAPPVSAPDPPGAALLANGHGDPAARQTAILELCADLKLDPTRITRTGFADKVRAKYTASHPYLAVALSDSARA